MLRLEIFIVSIILLLYHACLLGSPLQSASPINKNTEADPDTTQTYNITSNQWEGKDKIRLQVEGFNDHPQGGYTIYLAKHNNPDNLMLPIVIGRCEAMGVSRHLSGNQFRRPLTYELFTKLLDTTHIELKEIVVTSLQEGTFYANILLQKPSGALLKIDARPSDAINLALRLGVPIYTYQTVLDKAGHKISAQETPGKEDQH